MRKFGNEKKKKVRMNNPSFTHIKLTNDEEVKEMANNRSSNNLVVPQANQALDQLKYEIASEFGVQLGPDTTSRQNGSVGGEITKRLVSYAEQQLAGRG